MAKFSDLAEPLAGKIKTDFDPKHQNLPPQKHELTNLSTSDPHFIRFSVTREPTVEEAKAGKSAPIEVMNWCLRFPTRDAADSHQEDINTEIRHMLGEPEQAWADVVRMSKCPNPSMLVRFRNVSMELIPAPPPRQEPIPHDHPAYPNSFTAKRDAVTGVPHPESSGAPPSSAPEAGSGPDGGGPARVRKHSPRRAPPVPRERSRATASKGKAKQSPKAPRKRGRASKPD